MPVEDMVHPGESDWRRLRDYGFALTLAGRHPEAVPVLRQALEGCRRDQQGDPQLLPDLANILTRLLHCLPDETPLPEMMVFCVRRSAFRRMLRRCSTFAEPPARQ